MTVNNTSIGNDLSHIIFITGGTKSGKSEFAEYLAKDAKKLSYVALSQNNPNDNVAHFAHLGGMLFGYLLIKYWRKNSQHFY